MNNALENTTEFLAVEHAYAYGITLNTARHLTDEERPHYNEPDTIFIGTGTHINLDHISIPDLPKRPCEGSFLGCGNRSWIISQEEWDELLNLNAQRAADKAEKDRAEEIAQLEALKARAERQGTLYTPEEARQKRMEWIRVQNEGGEGYVPHYFTQDEYDEICQRLTELREKTT